MICPIGRNEPSIEKSYGANISLRIFSTSSALLLPIRPLWYRIKQIGMKAKENGIIKRDITLSPHLFRRAYAPSLYRSGMSIKAIQEKTRHASINTLIKHYIHDEEPAAPYLEKMLGNNIYYW